MLEFNYPTTICLHICNVLLTSFCFVDNLLPVDRKLSFPAAVPICFVLPPEVAGAPSLVSPMPNLDFSALGNHRVIASRALARKFGLSFLALSIDEREFHILVITVSWSLVSQLLCGGETGTFTISDASRLRFRKNCVKISEGAAKIVWLSLLELPVELGEALKATGFQAGLYSELCNWL